MNYIPSGMSIKQYFDRDAQRKKRRQLAAKFIAKIKGEPLSASKPVVIKQLDDITSLLVRRRDRAIYAGFCLVCKAKERLGLLDRAPEPIQLAYHILPRGDGLVHWDLRNIIGACSRCNAGELWSRTKASLRDRYKQIHIEIVGYEVYEELETLAGQTAHYTTADLIAMRDERKAQLEGRA